MGTLRYYSTQVCILVYCIDLYFCILQGNYSVYALKRQAVPYKQEPYNFTCDFFMEKVGGFYVDGDNISYFSQQAMNWPVSTSSIH